MRISANPAYKTLPNDNTLTTNEFTNYTRTLQLFKPNICAFAFIYWKAYYALFILYYNSRVGHLLLANISMPKYLYYLTFSNASPLHYTYTYIFIGITLDFFTFILSLFY